jgi:hypothetical protein
MAEDRYRRRVVRRGTIGNESRKRKKEKGRERIKERSGYGACKRRRREDGKEKR